MPTTPCRRSGDLRPHDLMNSSTYRPTRPSVEKDGLAMPLQPRVHRTVSRRSSTMCSAPWSVSARAWPASRERCSNRPATSSTGSRSPMRGAPSISPRWRRSGPAAFRSRVWMSSTVACSTASGHASGWSISTKRCSANSTSPGTSSTPGRASLKGSSASAADTCSRRAPTATSP